MREGEGKRKDGEGKGRTGKGREGEGKGREEKRRDAAPPSHSVETLLSLASNINSVCIFTPSNNTKG